MMDETPWGGGHNWGWWMMILGAVDVTGRVDNDTEDDGCHWERCVNGMLPVCAQEPMRRVCGALC